MPPLTVDPAALEGAGTAVVSIGDGLAAAVGVLAASYGANTGQDSAGEVFGLAYQAAAESVLKAAAAGINACRRVGFMVEVSASNYSRAEAASTLGGGAAVLPTPGQPGDFEAPGAPWTLGPGMAPPALWPVVQVFVGDLWPNGNPAQMNAAAASWRTFGAAFTGVKDALGGPNSIVSGQQMPEGGQIHQALATLGGAMDQIGAQCAKVGSALDDFAGEVQRTQDAIRDLLHRLGSASGLVHEVLVFLSGDGLDEIKRIADEISTVLDNMKREADAQEQLLQHGMGVLDGAVLGLEAYARRQFTHFLGDDVGNPLATVFDTYVNEGEGFIKGAVGMREGLQQLTPVRFAYDPQGAMATWKGMTETNVVNLLRNPRQVFEADLQFGKELLHLDDWRRDRPGLGAGENLFDVAMLAIPGGGAAGAGARGASAGARAAEEAAEAADAAGAVGRGGGALGEAGAIGRATGALGDITRATGDAVKDLRNLGTDLPKVEPAAGGRPIGVPPPRVGEPPVGPTAHAVESAPPGPDSLSRPPASPTAPAPAAGRLETPASPHQPAESGNHVASVVPQQPASAPATGELPPYAAGPGEHLLSTNPAPAEQPSAPVPAPAGGVPAESLPDSAHAAQPAQIPFGAHWHPPDSPPAGGHPPEPPPPHNGGPPNDGSTPGGDGGPRQPDPSPRGGHQDPIRSHAASGEGWYRLPDQPIDPYGGPLSEHWEFTHNPTEPSLISSQVTRLIEDSGAPFGRDARGHAYSQQEYEERFNCLSPAGDKWMKFPSNYGAMPGTRVAFTDINRFFDHYGNQVDRIGDESGKYLAVVEHGTPASWEARALHVNSFSAPYHSYTLEHLPEGWKIEVSEVAPGVGQPGGSIQVRILNGEDRIMTVDELEELGILR